MLPSISIGPLVLPTASLVTILGIWLALATTEKTAAHLRLDVPFTYNLATVALASGFIASRLAFVVAHWSAYRQNLFGIIWPLTGGYDLWAGLIAGFAVAFFYGRARQLPLGATLDALAPAILVGLMAVSLADFLGGPGYGVEADIPWSISLFGIKRHPVQLYELIAGIAALLSWLASSHGRSISGHLFLTSAAVYSSGRLFVDAYRANAALTANGYHIVQILSLAALLGALFLLMRGFTSSVSPESANISE